jgi:hypothetical protein
MDGSNGKQRIYHGRMVSQLRPKEDKVVTRLHNYYHDDEGLRRDRFSFRRQDGYYEWFEYHPHQVYLSSCHFANKTTAASVTGYVTGL